MVAEIGLRSPQGSFLKSGMPSTHGGIEEQQFNDCSMSAVGRGSFPLLAGQVGNSSIEGRQKALL
ncbi:hypothetical protein, partial [Synechococcus sp. H55.2]|uniref:hypothetical protein n=1 Tax=Synechococcus sp. H55.2 TaxID=2964505 RepID=UPI0039C17DF1